MSKVILFQGDSITDAGRNRDEGTLMEMGMGYPAFVKGVLGLDFPNEYKFYNKGISGNKITDVYARIERDILFLKPDYMSILIGVNDVWHGLHRVPNGTGAKRFEKVYDMLIEDILEELPDIKIMIMEPFVLEGPSTISDDEHPDRWERFTKLVSENASIAKALAEKHNLTFIPLQSVLDAAAKTMPATDILKDGVHPTPIGHELIKRAWLEAFESIK